MSGDRSEIAVPLDEIDQYGQHVEAVFILRNGRVIAVSDWYTHDDTDTYKLYSGGDRFHVRQEDVEQIATQRFLIEVVRDG